MKLNLGCGNELKRLIANRIIENGEAQIITKNIRSKIEETRK
jgi:hypothetical protein